VVYGGGSAQAWWRPCCSAAAERHAARREAAARVTRNAFDRSARCNAVAGTAQAALALPPASRLSVLSRQRSPFPAPRRRVRAARRAARVRGGGAAVSDEQRHEGSGGSKVRGMRCAVLRARESARSVVAWQASGGVVYVGARRAALVTAACVVACCARWRAAAAALRFSGQGYARRKVWCREKREMLIACPPACPSSPQWWWVRCSGRRAGGGGTFAVQKPLGEKRGARQVRAAGSQLSVAKKGEVCIVCKEEGSEAGVWLCDGRQGGRAGEAVI